jgi:hypothetical protein
VGAHVDFDEDGGDGGGVFVDGFNGGELAGVVNHERKTARTEDFRY